MNLIRETRMGADAKIDLEKVQCSFFLFQFLLVAMFQLSDVIPNTQTIPTLGISNPVPVWAWRHTGWALEGSSPLDLYSAVGLSPRLFAPASSRDDRASGFVHCLTFLWSPCRSMV